MDATLKPQALLVEDDAGHAEVLSSALAWHGLAVQWTTNLLDAVLHSQALLDISQPACPVVVVIDQRLPLAGYPELEGWVLAFWLRTEQLEGRLHPHRIVAMSAAMDERHRRQQAQRARCDWILAKDQLPAHIPAICTALTSPPPQIALDPAVQQLIEPAVTMLRFLAGQPRQIQRIWHPEEVRGILGLNTHAIHLREPERTQASTLVTRLGGASHVHALLRGASRQLDPAHRQLLEVLLRGELQRQEIEAALGLTRKTYDRALQLLLVALSSILSQPAS